MSQQGAEMNRDAAAGGRLEVRLARDATELHEDAFSTLAAPPGLERKPS